MEKAKKQKKIKNNKVAVIEKKEVVQQNQGQLNAEVLIQQAITQGVPVETMERLLAMRKELKQEWSKEQYDIAMGEFQMVCPIISKDRSVKDEGGKLLYKYAPLDSIVRQTRNLIRDNGFSYSIQTEPKDSAVKVTCVVKHKAGHSEEHSVEIPFGNKTRAMSDSQVAASAITFGKRYAFCNAFGILTGDEDVDGIAPKEEPKKTTLEDLEKRVISDIENAKDSGAVIKFDAYVQSNKAKAYGKDFSEEFKAKVKTLASRKVEQLDNGKA